MVFGTIYKFVPILINIFLLIIAWWYIMARKGYTTIALPNILIDQVEKIVGNSKHGYVSKPEFIKEAIREKIRKVEQEK